MCASECPAHPPIYPPALHLHALPPHPPPSRSPVSVRCPLALARPVPTQMHSMYCTLPPTEVHTRPAAVPGDATRSVEWGGGGGGGDQRDGAKEQAQMSVGRKETKQQHTAPTNWGKFLLPGSLPLPAPPPQPLQPPALPLTRGVVPLKPPRPQHQLDQRIVHHHRLLLPLLLLLSTLLRPQSIV